MERRSFLAGSAALLAAPLAAEAQPAGQVARIGYLSLESSPAQYLEAFHDGLRRLGYVDGGSIVIESRLAEGRTDKLPALASELVALKLDAIVGADGGAARALSRATKTIPIVMGVSGDPVELGARHQSRAARRECHRGIVPLARTCKQAIAIPAGGCPESHQGRGSDEPCPRR